MPQKRKTEVFLFNINQTQGIMETLTFPTTTESQAADAEQESKIVPATVVVNSIDCYVVGEQGSNKA
jgi:hypothetical protein